MRKLKKLAGLAIAGLIPSLIAGCKGNYNPANNQNVDVYGPPDMYEEYDARDNIEPCVYGGPEMIDNNSEKDASSNNVSANDVSFNDVSLNTISGNQKYISPSVDTSGNDFDPSLNIAEPVYGAPDPSVKE